MTLNTGLLEAELY